jgi:flagellar protein FliO/FliZ
MRSATLPACVLTLFAAVVTPANPAMADAVKFADPGAASTAAVSAISSMGQVTVALVVVLGVLFAAAWAMRRFRLFNGANRGALQIEQGINLGPKERAVLLKVNGRRVLLGVAPGCVNLLLELPAESAADESAAPTDQDKPSQADVAAPSFKALLKRSMGLS